MARIAIGFTGTRHGMTAPQAATFRRILEPYAGSVFHFGMCEGADEQASYIAHDMDMFVIGHPGHGKDDPDIHAHQHGHADQTLPPHPYLVRNHHIVDECELLIAAPRSPEIMRSGTWATVRYARDQRKPIIFAWRDGTTTPR